MKTIMYRGHEVVSQPLYLNAMSKHYEACIYYNVTRGRTHIAFKDKSGAALVFPDTGSLVPLFASQAMSLVDTLEPMIRCMCRFDEYARHRPNWYLHETRRCLVAR